MKPSWDNFLKKKKIKTCSTNSLTGERVKFEQGWGERKKKSVWINRDGRNLKGISPLLLAKHRKLYCSDLPLYREIWMTLTSQFAGWETGSFFFFFFFGGGVISASAFSAAALSGKTDKGQVCVQQLSTASETNDQNTPERERGQVDYCPHYILSRKSSHCCPSVHSQSAWRTGCG